MKRETISTRQRSQTDIQCKRLVLYYGDHMRARPGMGVQSREDDGRNKAVKWRLI